MEDAAGAALKAIQCVEMASRGEAVHPRAGDRSYPDFFNAALVPSANDALRNVLSAPSMKTKNAILFLHNPLPAVRYPAWGPVRNESFPLKIIRWI